MKLEKVNRGKLSQEFCDAGIDANSIRVSAINNNNLIGAEIEFIGDIDMDLVQSIIDAHDPTPLLKPPTLDEQLAEKDAQILKLKEEQFMTQQMTLANSSNQQELIELLMDMGVI